MSRNRNRRQNINTDSHQPPKGFIKDYSSDFFNNLIRDIKKTINNAKETPIDTIKTVGSVVASLTGGTLLFSGSDGGSSSVNYNYAPSILDGLLSFFPGRIMAFFVLTMSLGWVISLIGIWLTKNITDIRSILAHTVTAFGAIFLALSIESIFKQDISQKPFFVLLLAILGVTFSIYIAKTNFKQNHKVRPEITAARASLLMNFSCVTACLVMFTQATGLS